MMKNLLYFSFFLTLIISLSSCESIDTFEIPSAPVNQSSIAPSSIWGRSMQKLACVETYERESTIALWDHGIIDGDIVSIIINDLVIVDKITLDGPDNKFYFNYTFDYDGYNYLSLYAHNEGDISPNTAAISLNGRQFTLESNLSTNGYVDVVIPAQGVECGF